MFSRQSGPDSLTLFLCPISSPSYWLLQRPDSAAPGRKKKPNARVFWIDVVNGPLRLPVRLGGLASESALHLASHDCAAVHLIRSPTEHWTRPQRASPPLARGPPSAGRYFVFGIISIDSAVLPTESFPV
jgi:hypothetical protein